MFGPPEDIEGKCNAALFLGDDHGDNTTTFKCQLEPGHEGPHQEVFNREGVEHGRKPVTVRWWNDERVDEAVWSVEAFLRSFCFCRGEGEVGEDGKVGREMWDAMIAADREGKEYKTVPCPVCGVGGKL